MNNYILQYCIIHTLFSSVAADTADPKVLVCIFFSVNLVCLYYLVDSLVNSLVNSLVDSLVVDSLVDSLWQPS